MTLTQTADYLIYAGGVLTAILIIMRFFKARLDAAVKGQMGELQDQMKELMHRFELSVQDHHNFVDKISEEIARLEAKQDKHNQVVERMIKLESSDEQQWHQLDDLKKKLP